MFIIQTTPRSAKNNWSAAPDTSLQAIKIDCAMRIVGLLLMRRFGRRMFVPQMFSIITLAK
jgi:hypothetical protein